MNVGEYLKSNFPGGVQSYKEVTSNGQIKGYYVRGNNGDEMYLPANTSGNTGMLSYIPGSGGSGNDAAKIREQINNNPPDYPITIAASCSDKNNCIETGYQLAQGANMNVTNNVTVCFSASGYLGITRTESFEDRHPDVVSTVISCEPYNTGAYKYTDPNNTDGLSNSNSQILFVGPSTGFHVNLENEIKNMTNAGLNAYFLETAYTGNSGSVHIRTNADILTNGIIEYLLGYTDDFNRNPGEGSYSPNYKLVKFNETTGSYEEMSYEELAATVKAIKIPDIEKLTSVDSFKIETKVSPVHNKYETLKSLNRKEVTGSVMKTNYVYANDKMNNLRDLIQATSFINNFNNQTFRSSEGIPGCIAGYLNAYYDIVGSLLNSLSLETDSVLSYTQAVVDLDNDLAASLTPGEIVQNSNVDGMIAIGLENTEDNKTQQENSTNNNNNQVPSYQNPSSSNGGNNGGGTPSYTPTVPLPTVEEQQEPTPDYVYDFDGYQGLIYMEEGKISEIKFRYTYNSIEEAQKELETIKEVYKEKEFIKEVLQDGFYIDAIFHEDYYKEKTYEEIVKEYFEGGELHG